VAADQFGRLEAVDVGHVDVEQNDGERALQDPLQGFRARSGLDDVRVEIFQQAAVNEQLLGKIVDNEYACTAHMQLTDTGAVATDTFASGSPG
jgi:hypothetical protein